MVSPTRRLDLADTADLVIFEDAAQAHLAEREGYRAGSIGMAAAFSFYPSKNLGAMGDSGRLVTQDSGVADRMRTLRNYGAPRKYHHTEVGTNSRLDTIQAAILNVKLPQQAGIGSATASLNSTTACLSRSNQGGLGLYKTTADWAMRTICMCCG
jgi:dTDP-4-amino-4,6-dideoxygalactose transaminase